LPAYLLERDAALSVIKITDSFNRSIPSADIAISPAGANPGHATAGSDIPNKTVFI